MTKTKSKRFNAAERARDYLELAEWVTDTEWPFKPKYAKKRGRRSLARLLREVYRKGVRDALKYKCEVCKGMKALEKEINK